MQYFEGHRELCSRCGVELDDVQQQSFFAFLQSVEAYNPESGLVFVSFIDFHFKTEMQNLTGTRTALTRLDPLNNCASLDKVIETDDDSGDTLGDFVPDLTALDFLELLDAESVGEMIRAEVRRLPAPFCNVIAWYYFDGQTLETIAKRLDLSLERVRQLKKRGLVTLSKRRVLVDLWNETHHTEQLRQLEHHAKRNRPDECSSLHTYEQKARTPSCMKRGGVRFPPATRSPAPICCGFCYPGATKQRESRNVTPLQCATVPDSSDSSSTQPVPV